MEWDNGGGDGSLPAAVRSDEAEKGGKLVTGGIERQRKEGDQQSAKALPQLEVSTESTKLHT